MATAKKLPSGNYRVRIYDNDTKKYKSFTAETKKEAELKAAEWLNGKRIVKKSEITVEEAVENYIKSKDKTLSVSTIRGYYIIKKNAINEIKNKRIDQITEIELQKWMNNNAEVYSPKSIRNQFGLITAALKQNKIKLDYSSILLKPKQPKELRIPNTDEMKKILQITKDTNIELPILFALTLGLRRSEICALTWDDYDGEKIYIHSAAVPNSNNKTIIKETNKSYAGTRTLTVPDILKQILNKQEHKSGFIVNMSPNGIFVRFQSLCEQNGLPKFTLHSLRHANASLMLIQGVPDKYAMERLGQATNSMLRNVYQHTFKDEQNKISDEINNAFNKML
jgi:integrase